jgi:hypothetical protein
MPGHSVHQGLLVLKMAVYGRLAHPQFLCQLAETGILVKSAAPHPESRLDNLRICHFLSTQARKSFRPFGNIIYGKQSFVKGLSKKIFIMELAIPCGDSIVWKKYYLAVL